MCAAGDPCLTSYLLKAQRSNFWKSKIDFRAKTTCNHRENVIYYTMTEFALNNLPLRENSETFDQPTNYPILNIVYVGSKGELIMKCPFCGFEDTKVIDSRPSDEKKRRRRECGNCGKRFTTYEVVEKPLLMVYKKDGSFEPFDRMKIINGLQTAIKKRPVGVNAVNALVDDIENTYANAMQTETTTSEIGDKVLQGLKKLDLVAYVRFASVYKDFNDVDSFIQIISELSDENGRKAEK